MSFYQDEHATILLGDCLDVMRTMEAESVDALVTDPPAGISFMNASWDSNKGSRNQWIAWLTEVMEEALRVMKPGAHGLVWALPRTSHWTGMALEDAGFEVREKITHHFGSGFPKSANIGKNIDKMAKANEETKRRIAAVAQLIAAHREAKGKTRAEVSEAVVGTPSGACWNWEHHQLPSVEMWHSIKDVLGIPDDYDALIDGDRSQWIAAEREVVGSDTKARSENGKSALPTVGAKVKYETWDLTAPATDEAKQWAGWGSGLKPSTEDWWLIRKPLSEKNIALNVLKWGCGAINVDASRVGTEQISQHGRSKDDFGFTSPEKAGRTWTGRFPANLLLSHVPPTESSPGCVRVGTKRVKSHNPDNKVLEGEDTTPHAYGKYSKRSEVGHADPDGTEQVEAYDCARDEAGNYTCPVALMDEQSGTLKSNSGKAFKRNPDDTRNAYGAFNGKDAEGYYGDSGGASRFFMQFPGEPDTGWGAFYTAKASRRERNQGLEGMPERVAHDAVGMNTGGSLPQQTPNRHAPQSNFHPTVKPLKLMAYLVKMVTPPGGLVLDPFAGSGTTLLAARQEGFRAVGIEREEEYASIAARRLSDAPLVLEVG